MILRFNKETIALVEKVSKKVAKRLQVDSADLCVATGKNADPDRENIRLSLCFETSEDDTFAVLDLMSDQNTDIKPLLNGFMNNPDVDWRKCNNAPEAPSLNLTWEELQELDELTENIKGSRVLGRVRGFIDDAAE